MGTYAPSTAPIGTTDSPSGLPDEAQVPTEAFDSEQIISRYIEDQMQWVKQAGEEWCTSGLSVEIAAGQTQISLPGDLNLYHQLLTQKVLPLGVDVKLCCDFGDCSDTLTAFAASSRCSKPGPILPNFENLRDFAWFEDQPWSAK